MRPERVATAEPEADALARAADLGVRYLEQHAGDATGWSTGMATAAILALAACRTAGRATMPQSPIARQAPSTP